MILSRQGVYMIEKESQREEREIARMYRTLYCCSKKQEGMSISIIFPSRRGGTHFLRFENCDRKGFEMENRDD